MQENISIIIIIKTTEIIKMMIVKRNFMLKIIKLISIKSEYITNISYFMFYIQIKQYNLKYDNFF